MADLPRLSCKMKYITLFALIGLLALANASTPFDSVHNQVTPYPYGANLPFSLRVKNPTVGTVVTLSDTDMTPGFEAKFTLTSATQSEVSFGGTSLTVPVPAGSTDFVIVFFVTPNGAGQVSFGPVVYTNIGSFTSASNANAASSSALVGDVKLLVAGSVSRVTVYPYPYVLSQSEASAIFGANGDCFDSVQNNMETAVDCGGTQGCAACTCSDNVKNQGEFGPDCGFPCFDQCSDILDVPLNSFDGGVTSGVESFSRTPTWVPSRNAANTASNPLTREGVMYLEADSFDVPVVGTLVPVTFASKFTVRIIASFSTTDLLDEASLLNCGDALYVYVNGADLKAKLRGVNMTLVGLNDPSLGNDWQDIIVVVTPTAISGQVHSSLSETAVAFSVPIVSADPAPTGPIQCKIGDTSVIYGTYADRYTIYNGLALSSAQQSEMYDAPPALGHCADGVKNEGETGVDCGDECSRMCPTDDGNNGGGNNGNTCPNCAAGTNVQVIPSSGIRGGEYGLVSTSGTCITVRVHA